MRQTPRTRAIKCALRADKIERSSSTRTTNNHENNHERQFQKNDLVKLAKPLAFELDWVVHHCIVHIIRLHDRWTAPLSDENALLSGRLIKLIPSGETPNHIPRCQGTRRMFRSRAIYEYLLHGSTPRLHLPWKAQLSPTDKFGTFFLDDGTK